MQTPLELIDVLSFSCLELASGATQIRMDNVRRGENAVLSHFVCDGTTTAWFLSGISPTTTARAMFGGAPHSA